MLLWTLSAGGRSLVDAAGRLAVVATSVTSLARFDPGNRAFRIVLVTATSTAPSPSCTGWSPTVPLGS